MSYTIRPARTRDVPVIRKLIDSNVEPGRLLSKATVTLYEDIQEFCVAELTPEDALAGCGALHVMWEDLAEIRTVAVREDCRGLGIGHGIVDTLLQRASALGVDRVFVLTFAVDFFGRHGFAEINGTPVAAEVYQELLRSYDEGVAEFLDLGWVKPNTLGNTRMLLRLLPNGNDHRRCAAGDRGPAGASAAADGREEPAMWQDLAALTPPLVVCVAFLIGLAMFLRREMSPKRRAERAAKRRSSGPRS
jgi:amino-acid N-acetyltransferase